MTESNYVDYIVTDPKTNLKRAEFKMRFVIIRKSTPFFFHGNEVTQNIMQYPYSSDN